MKTESAIWQSIKKATSDKVHWTRIEARVGSGIPDLNGCFDRGEFWIELKVCKTSRYQTKGLWRPQQIAWQMKRACVFANVFNLVSHPSLQCCKIYGASKVLELHLGNAVKPDLTLSYPVNWQRLLDHVGSNMDLVNDCA